MQSPTDNDPAPPYCVSYTSPGVHATAYDGNPICTPATGQWDSSWASYLPNFCDSWFHSVSDTTSWIRVTPLWWNVTCDCSASQLDTHNARKAGCSDPHSYQLTKYIMFTNYTQTSHDQFDPATHEKTGSLSQYKMIGYYKGWSTNAPNAQTRGGGTHDMSIVHVCSSESKGVTYSILGKVGDGLPILVPDVLADQAKGVDGSAAYLLCMGAGQPNDLYIMDGSTPETMQKRIARMDYVDIGAPIVDPPIHKALSGKFWIRLSVVLGLVLVAIAVYKKKGPKKN